MEAEEHLRIAHRISKEFEAYPVDTITDEARLLTGCLHALVAIAVMRYGGHPYPPKEGD